MLTAKARLLYEDLLLVGGGKEAEGKIRARTGLSHGSFSAARQELIREGLLTVEKDGRQAVYVLAAKKAEEEPVERAALPAGSDGEDSSVMMAVLPSMPRVTGHFVNFDDWEEALMQELGSCLDISEGLIKGVYTVYSHQFEEAAQYEVKILEDGLLVE